MIEELKLIVELFNGTTTKAIYAFVAFGLYKLAYLSIIVFPSYGALKFFISRMFEEGGQGETKKSKKSSSK